MWLCSIPTLCTAHTGLQDPWHPFLCSLSGITLPGLFSTTDIRVCLGPCQPSLCARGHLEGRDRGLAHSRNAVNDCQLSMACPSPVATFLKSRTSSVSRVKRARGMWGERIGSNCQCGLTGHHGNLGFLLSSSAAPLPTGPPWAWSSAGKALLGMCVSCAFSRTGKSSGD